MTDISAPMYILDVRDAVLMIIPSTVQLDDVRLSSTLSVQDSFHQVELLTIGYSFHFELLRSHEVTNRCLNPVAAIQVPYSHFCILKRSVPTNLHKMEFDGIT